MWVGEDRAIRQEFAIKILRPGISIQQGLQEAYVGHSLSHENLVRVHQADVVQFRGHDYVMIAMDYMPNGPVTRLANRRGFISLPQVVALGRDILRGLDYLHGHGFYHNDIKPDNVLIGPQEQGMLTDYGIVGVSHAGTSVSPPRFYRIHAAPEVITANEISVRTDIFQVGLTLFRVLCGLCILRRKFESVGEQEYYDSIIGSGLILASDVPPYIPARVIRILKKATHPSGSHRYQSAVEMLRELEKLNYPGYWTVNDEGELVGNNRHFEYRFELRQRRRGRCDVTAFRRRLSTGKETRYGKHCVSDLSEECANGHINNFIRAVVEEI